MFSINIIAPFQTSFTIKNNCKRLTNSIILKHGKYAIESISQTDITIIAKKEKSGYNIYFNGNCLKTNAPLREIERIMYENRKYAEDVFAVHGGAVEFNNGAYLIVAATTSGKTTLTSYLTSNGCGYITDDCVLIDRINFNIHPFTTPMHLRQGGFEVLKNLGLEPKQFEFLNDVSIKRYVYTPKNCVTHQIPLKKIFFIERTENINDSQDMSTTEKMTYLLKSPIINYKLDANYLSFISRLAKVPCKKLYYCDMDFVFKEIKNG